ncbi:MAG: DUF721 domain-containing protein [Deltaproteobacteria bacterium]|nr:DUF721 domain-containing protein [Deltaproteobacteria bacterium]
MAKKSNNKFPRNLGMQHVGRQMPSFGKGKNVFQTVELRRLWPEIVGEYLAQKTYVKKVYLQKLIVAVAHGGWAYQLNMMKSDILNKLQKKSNIKITDIQWQQEDIADFAPQTQSKSMRNKFSRKDLDTRDSTLQDILMRVRALQKDITK